MSCPYNLYKVFVVDAVVYRNAEDCLFGKGGYVIVLEYLVSSSQGCVSVDDVYAYVPFYGRCCTTPCTQISGKTVEVIIIKRI